MVHAQGYGLNTPPQIQGGVSGLTLATPITNGDGFTITAPDGTTLNIVVPTPVAPATQRTVADLIAAINAAGVSHGVQAALDSQGRFIVYSSPTVYGSDGTALGTPAQIAGNGSTGLTSSTGFAGGGSMTLSGPTGTATFSTFAGENVGQLLQQINGANLGINASLNSVGEMQLTSLNNGSGQSIKITAATATDFGNVLGLPAAPPTLSVSGLDRGFLPSSTIKVSTPLASTQSEVMGSFAGVGPPSPLTTTTNSNQVFFQGAKQVLQNQLMSELAGTSSLNTAAATTFTAGAGLLQPVFPAQISLTLAGAATFPTTFTVNGTDASGAAISDAVTFNADGIATTSKTFQTLTNITTAAGVTAAAGFASARLGVSTNAPATQYDTAASLVVDANILNDATLIAASSVPSAPGNATNALALLNVQQQGIIGNGQTPTTIGDFYSANTANLGAAASAASTSLQSEQQLVQHIQTQKQSVVGVSLDEEAANLVALQHAYEAAARAITTQDSMLNTIINGMGLVGLGGGGA
jgi:flagellar hook-associated protein FlgK